MDNLTWREEIGLSDPHRSPDPSPEEIRRMCAEIQETWSLQEEQLRRGVAGNRNELKRDYWTPPVARTVR